MLTVIPNVTDVRRVDNGQSTESTCRGFGDGVMVRWNTSELGPDVQFNVTCVDDLSACRLRLRGPLSPVHVHCIAANDVGNDVHAWTLYASGINLLPNTIGVFGSRIKLGSGYPLDVFPGYFPSQAIAPPSLQGV